MRYEIEKFDYLLGLPGFSDQLLQNHFALYEGYVKNTNKLAELLLSLESGVPEYAELKRRFGWEWNGMRLHELYFESLTKDYKELEKDSDLGKKIDEIFGSFEKWSADFKAVGAMRGIGWAVLYFDPESGSLFNVWINEHDGGHLSGAVPLLIMDVFEHAHYPDYGKDRAKYIEAFMGAVNWEKIEERLQKAL